MSLTSKLIQSWVLDYACLHYFESVIQEVSKRNHGRLNSLDVCHARLSCSTIHSIIHKEQVSRFDLVIDIMEQFHMMFESDIIDVDLYNRIITGVKIRLLFNELRTNINNSLLKLNIYFPRTPVNNETKQLQEKRKNFRKFFLSLVSNKEQRVVYLDNKFDSDFGSEFMKHLKSLMDQFLNHIQTYVGPPIIDQLLNSECSQDVPVFSPETEILLDYFYDIKQRHHNNTASNDDEETPSLKFKEEDLLHMLNLLCPVNPHELPSLDMDLGT
ncbi:uncharacterized protein LOC115211143 [Argonauta hians]